MDINSPPLEFVLGPASDQRTYAIELSPLDDVPTGVEAFVQPKWDGTSWNDVLYVRTTGGASSLTVNVRVYALEGFPIISETTSDIPPFGSVDLNIADSVANSTMGFDASPLSPGGSELQTNRCTLFEPRLTCIEQRPVFGPSAWSDVITVANPSPVPVTASLQAYDLSQLPLHSEFEFSFNAGELTGLILGSASDNRAYVAEITPLDPGAAGGYIDAFIQPEFFNNEWIDVLRVIPSLQNPTINVQVRIRRIEPPAPPIELSEAVFRGIVTDDALNGIDFFGEEVNVGDPFIVRLTFDENALFRSGPFPSGNGENSAYDLFPFGNFAVDVGEVSLNCSLPFFSLSDELGLFGIKDRWIALGFGGDCAALNIDLFIALNSTETNAFSGTEFFIPDDISKFEIPRFSILVPDFDSSGEPILRTSVRGEIVAAGEESTPQGQLVELLFGVADLDLPAGTQESLNSTIENALARVQAGDVPPALGMLHALVQKLNAQRGKKIPEAEADELIAIAEATIAQLEAPVIE